MTRALLWAAALCFALAAVLGARRLGAQRPRWVVLVDASRSVEARHPDAPPRRRAELARWLDEATAARARVELWVAGSGVERRVGPCDAEALRARIDDPRLCAPAPAPVDATPLALALARIEAAEPLALPARLHWIGDSGWTGADPGPALQRLAARDCAVSAFEYGAPLVSDRGIAALELLEPWDGRSALRGSLELAAHGETERVELHVRAGGCAPWRIQLDLDPRATRRVPFELAPLAPVPSGALRIEAAIAQSTGGADAFPDNDQAVRWVRVGTAPSAAWVGLPAPPGAQGCATYDELPPWALLDVIAARDLPAEPARAAALFEWIRGGGLWLLLGADSAASAHALEDDRLYEALPLALRGDGRERRVRLCVDVSGSMQGAAFDELRPAALELARRAPLEDRLEWCRFAAQVGPVELLRAPGRATAEAAREDAAAALERMLAGSTPSGATALLALVEQALAEPVERRADVLFVLSDGRESGAREWALARAQALSERARALGMRIAPVAAGAHADVALLDALGTEPTLSAAPGALARALLSRAQDGVLGDAGTALPRAEYGGPLARALWPAGLPEFDSVAGRVARVETRAGAETWAELAGAPLGALRRVGAGWIAQLAWQPALERWPQPILTALAARSPRRASGCRVRDGWVEWEDAGERAAPAPRVELWLRTEDGSAEHALELVFDPRRAAYVGALPAQLPALGTEDSQLIWIVLDSDGAELARSGPELSPEARLPVARTSWPGPATAAGATHPASGPPTRWLLAALALGAGLLALAGLRTAGLRSAGLAYGSKKIQA